MAGIVLAGGRSRRMGENKALLPYDGTTLLAHVCEVVSGVSGRAIVVAGAADSFAPADLPAGTVVAGDLYPGQGPVGGIVTGLRAAGEGIHVVVACDMPRVQPDLLRLLIAQAQGWDAAVPDVAGRLEPLCAAYDARSADALEGCLLAGRRALHVAVAHLHANVLGEALLRTVDPGLVSFTNINTPEDYRKSRA